MNDIENNIIIFIIIPFYFMNFIYILKKAPKKTLNHITLATICFNVFYLHSYIVIVEGWSFDAISISWTTLLEDVMMFEHPSDFKLLIF